MQDILAKIVKYKRIEVERRKRDGIRGHEKPVAPYRPFSTLFSYDDFVIIAEVKKASPSKGVICADFEPVSIASDYERGGASAISVLTDEHFFQGSLEFLSEIRNSISLPLLRKDFIIDHFQVDEALVWGADAILLIVACLDDSELQELYLHARENGLDCLVEVHDLYEFERAMKAEVDLVGVNNRNLRDFTVSLDTTLSVLNEARGIVPVISESGINSRDDICLLADAGASGALIGESLMRSDDRVKKLQQLLGSKVSENG